MMARSGLPAILAGGLIGLGGAVALSRGLAALLFGVSPLDALTFAATALVLMLVAALAVYLPSRRAAAVDPVWSCATRETGRAGVCRTVLFGTLRARHSCRSATTGSTASALRAAA